jgi:alpha-glucoside transport system substrate-binding protein
VNTKRALALAAVLLLVATSVVGCQTADNGGGGNGGEEIGAVTVMGLWGGTELEAFEAVVAGWEAETGGTVEFESTRDLSAILRTRVEGGNPPDLAILPNPALMQEFAGSGKLLAIDDVLDMNTIGDDYGKAWTDLGTIDGKLYGLFVKAATKSTVWYNPTVFSEKGYTTPTTWDELIALSDKIKTDAGVPWSIGIEAGAATGWPATDWIQEILLAESGPDVYDQWVNHEIPWTDDAVKSAFERFGEIALADGYVVGGVNSTLATKPEDASYLPFESPPKAYLYFLGAFTQNFVAAQFPDLVAGEDYDFFKFPPIDPANAGAVTGGADVLSMFKDTPSSRSLMEYLADGANWESWATAGGFSSPSLALNASAYPDDLAAKAAAQLTESEIFRFDADDLMPAELQTAYFSATANYLQNPGQLDAILTSLEEVAKTAYAK